MAAVERRDGSPIFEGMSGIWRLKTPQSLVKSGEFESPLFKPKFDEFYEDWGEHGEIKAQLHLSLSYDENRGTMRRLVRPIFSSPHLFCKKIVNSQSKSHSREGAEVTLRKQVGDSVGRVTKERE